MLHQRKKALVNQAPSTHDPKRTSARPKSRSAAVFSGGEEPADLPILQASIVEIEGTWYEPEIENAV
jgi:hypothetical protein